VRRVALLLAAVTILSACVAETVERRRPRKGPVKEVGFVDYGGGRVRYSAEGWSWIVSSRRRLALKLMSRNCGSDLEPRIVDEFTRQDADATYTEEDISSTMTRGDEHYVVEHFTHLTYECRPHGWTEPAVSTSAVHAPVVVVPVSTAAVAVPLSTAPAAVPLSTAPPSVPVSSSTMPSLPESR
jgi:hypothetical protein